MSKKIDLMDLLLSRTSDLEPIITSSDGHTALENAIPNNLLFDSEKPVFKPETVATGGDGGVRPLSIEETKEFESKIDKCIDEIFQEGIHYGKVQGIGKAFLFKAGAEVIVSMLGLVARTEICDKIEDYERGVFCYTAKTWLLDGKGCIRSEGYGICSSKERKYQKQDPFNLQNILIKLARKRSFLDACLTVASLSNRFSQDEDLVEVQPSSGESSQVNATSKQASDKQIRYLESLMSKYGTTVTAMNNYVKDTFDVDSYKDITSTMASEIINKYKALDGK